MKNALELWVYIPLKLTAKEAIAHYEEVAKQWEKSRAEYHYEEYALDGNYYYEVTKDEDE